MSTMPVVLPEENEGLWEVGHLSGEPDACFLAERGGSICFVDGLTRKQAMTIAERHNIVLATAERRLAELRELCADAYQVVGALDGPVEMLDRLSAAAQEPVCPRCNGTGEVDSGGFDPQGNPISIACECQSAQEEREHVA